jgi:hypothetical protein
MLNINALIQDLESSDSEVRNTAALNLMDIQAEAAVKPLISAILKPENVNHRGTLVYALSAFNCEAFLEILVDLALTGNYEVAVGACSIIYETTLSPDTIKRIQAQLLKYDSITLATEHNREANQQLLELVAEESSDT